MVKSGTEYATNKSVSNLIDVILGMTMHLKEEKIVKFKSPVLLDDPLEELLNEFSHLEDEMPQSDHLELRSDHEDYLFQQIELLEEAYRRMKYYIDEIEMFHS